jgi:capsular polysaccharide transport system permease protein
MTTPKPKAKKFRIRRGGSLGQDTKPAPVAPEAPAPDPAAVNPGMPGEVTSAREVSTEEAIEAIRKEKLTGRQLRMARRVAQKHGLKPTSDFDAIRLLRGKGIDPFQRANMLELVVDEEQKAQSQLPQTVPAKGEALPSTEVLTENTRAKEIMEIQRDIARRRRRKLTLLIARLSFFVFLPTILAGYYYYNIATPMYSTQTQFVIQKGEQPAPGGLGSALAGTGLASNQDSVVVQAYLQSRAAMERLDADIGFKDHYSQDWIDPIQKLEAGATNEEAYKLYKKEVLLSYDPSEGIIKMEVITAEPKIGLAYSEALISYAEEQVDQLTSRKREEQMKGARESYDEAEAARATAQAKLLALQKKFGVLDAGIDTQLLTQKIGQLELLQVQDQLGLVELESNARPNPAQLDPLKRRLAARGKMIADFRSQLTNPSSGGVSIAVIQSQQVAAQADLEVRNMMMQSSLQSLETARVEAARQTRFLSLAVPPVQADEAKYPRKFENTILAFLVFSGIYLMLSLTASILREQVSS